MEYSELLAEDESWNAFEKALEEAVQSYVQSLRSHLTEEYNNYNITVRGLESDEELLDALGLEDYDVTVSAEDQDFRMYDIELPGADEPLMIEAERSVAESSVASDEDRETVAYNMVSRSGQETKFRNIRSEFCRLTQPDVVNGDVPVFYRDGDTNPLKKLDSWEEVDKRDFMQKAVERYEDSFPADVDFDLELGFDSGKGWRIYEFDFSDIDEKLHLEMSLRSRGFGFNWRPDDYEERYHNFVREGFAEALEDVQ